MMKQCLPEGFIGQLLPLLGPALPDFLHSYDLPPTRGIRMRPGIPPSGTGEPVPWAENGYYLPLDSWAGASPLHEAGAYYIQEPSAMVPAAALKPEPGDRVLDLCAAPGGKSTQLAAYMEGRGVIVCNEPVPARAQVLSRNIERMGVINAVVTCALPEELSPRWPGYFDKILVDAPCSGEGMFRRHPETRAEWTAAAPAGCAQRQERILEHASAMLCPGGLIAYSTCTFNALENEGVIQGFLHRHPEFSLVPFALPGLPASDGMLRLWPHEIQGEGHFAALLRKTEDSGRPTEKKRITEKREGLPFLPKPETALADGFLREHIADPVRPNAVFSGHAVQTPDEMPPLSGVRVLRVGLEVGQIRGKIFAPDHALALACRSLLSVPVSEDQARAYQAGQVLPMDEELRGFCTPVLDGMQLGWGKISQGQMKNHSPKGLRRP